MATETTTRNREALDQTSEAFTTTYENAVASYRAWFDRAEEVRQTLSDAYLDNLQTVIERNRETYRRGEAYSQRLADLQRDWVTEMSRQFRGYQTQAFEQYRSSVQEAISAWTDITSRQLNDFAGRIQRMGGDVETFAARAREENERAVATTAANVERGAEAAQATATSAVEATQAAINASADVAEKTASTARKAARANGVDS